MAGSRGLASRVQRRHNVVVGCAVGQADLHIRSRGNSGNLGSGGSAHAGRGRIVNVVGRGSGNGGPRERDLGIAGRCGQSYRDRWNCGCVICVTGGATSAVVAGHENRGCCEDRENELFHRENLRWNVVNAVEGKQIQPEHMLRPSFSLEFTVGKTRE